MQKSVLGLVVGSVECSNDSKLLSILTKDEGIIKAYCKNKLIKRKSYISAASVEVLSYTQFDLNENRSIYNVNRADSEMMFGLVRTDIDRLAIGQYLCDIVATVSTQGYGDDEYLKFIMNTLYILNKPEVDPYLIKAIGEFKLMCLAGFMPNVMTCDNCGNFEIDHSYFNLVEGTILCNNCCNEVLASTTMLNNTILNVLRHICVSNGAKLYSFSIPQNQIAKLNSITEMYVKYKVEINYNSLKYIHNLQNAKLD